MVLAAYVYPTVNFTRILLFLVVYRAMRFQRCVLFALVMTYSKHICISLLNRCQLDGYEFKLLCSGSNANTDYINHIWLGPLIQSPVKCLLRFAF